MTRYLLILLSLLISVAHAAPRSRKVPKAITRCLGSEERYYHKKKLMGADYQLNQRLIDEMVLLTHTDIAPVWQKEVCSKAQGTALRILRLLLLAPEEWYVVKSDLDSVQASIASELLDDLHELAPELFLQYIQQLQGEAPKAGCLEKHVPGLASLYEDIKWLQEEVDMSRLMGNKKRLRTILRHLDKVEAIFGTCQAEVAAEKKAQAEKDNQGTKKKTKS